MPDPSVATISSARWVHCRVRPDGTDLRRLTAEGRKANIIPDRVSGLFSPDGTSLLIDDKERDPGEAIVAVRLADGSEAILAEGMVGGARFSPDGRSLAFIQGAAAATDGHSTNELWVADRDGGNARLVTRDVCGCSPTCSPGSSLLATWTPDWNQVVIVPADGSAEAILVPSQGNIGVMSWQAVP